MRGDNFLESEEVTTIHSFGVLEVQRDEKEQEAEQNSGDLPQKEKVKMRVGSVEWEFLVLKTMASFQKQRMGEKEKRKERRTELDLEKETV